MIEIGVVLVSLVCVSCGGAAAQPGCGGALTGMAACVNYVTGNSPTPSSQCCSQLTSVVRSSPQCLCSVINSGGGSFGININQTLALQLPATCNVQTPPVSQCNATNDNGPKTPAISPVVSPKGFPVGDTPDAILTPSAPEVPGDKGAGSKTIPSANGVSLDSNVLKTPFSLAVFLVSAASCAFVLTIL